MSNWSDALDKAAAELLRCYLAQTGGKAGPAAKAAGINRSAFYGLLKRYGVEYTPVERAPAPPRNKTNRRLGPKHSLKVADIDVRSWNAHAESAG